MKINSIKINGFKGFDNYTHIFSEGLIELLSNHDEMTACKIMVSQFYKCFPGCKTRNFSRNDISHDGNANIFMHMTMDDDSSFIINKSLKKDDCTKTDISGLVRYFNNVKKKIDDGKPEPLPIIAYYNAENCKYDITPYEKSFTDIFPRYKIYDSGSIEDITSFRNFFNWFELAEDDERRMECKLENFNYETNKLQFVRKILSSISRYSNLKTNVYPWSFLLSNKTDNFVVDILKIDESERFTILLFCDIASRIAEANINNNHVIDMPENSTGIVMIDNLSVIIDGNKIKEISDKIHKVFPNIQFLFCN